MKRRQFSAGLIAGAALAGSGIAIVSHAAPAMPSHMQRQAFEARLNQSVYVKSVNGGIRCRATLDSIDDAGSDKQFYVRFAARRPETFAEDLYVLKMQDGTRMLLHLMPSVSDSRVLEAVINQAVY